MSARRSIPGSSPGTGRASMRQAHVCEAALDFITAIEQSSAYLSDLEQSPRHVFEAMRLGGAAIPSAFYGLPGVDLQGRALIVSRRNGDGKIAFGYLRRTRLLAAETAPSRRAFVSAIKAHPRAAREEARLARKVFPRALWAAHRRDKAASNG